MQQSARFICFIAHDAMLYDLKKRIKFLTQYVARKNNVSKKIELFTLCKLGTAKLIKF